MKVRTFYEAVFGFKVHLLVDCDPKSFKQYVRKISNPKYKNPGSFYAICHTKDTNVIIGLSEWKANAHDIAALSHETAHAAFRSLTRRGIQHTSETDEVFSYLQDFLLRRSLWALGVK